MHINEQIENEAIVCVSPFVIQHSTLSQTQMISLNNLFRRKASPTTDFFLKWDICEEQLNHTYCALSSTNHHRERVPLIASHETLFSVQLYDSFCMFLDLKMCILWEELLQDIKCHQIYVNNNWKIYTK